MRKINSLCSCLFGSMKFKIAPLLFPIILYSVLPVHAVLHEASVKPKLAKIRMPFIENQGQIKDASVKYYANTFAGTVFITDRGEITYSLVSEDRSQPQSKIIHLSYLS